MDQYYELSSSSSCSTIINESWREEFVNPTTENNTKTPENRFSDEKHLYDLNHFETVDLAKQKSFHHVNSDEVLKELSQKYSSSTSTSFTSSVHNLEEIVVLSDSSSEEECDPNTAIFKTEKTFNHKNSYDTGLDKDFEILENQHLDYSEDQEVEQQSKKEDRPNVGASNNKNQLSDIENNFPEAVLGLKEISDTKHDENKTDKEKKALKKIERAEKKKQMAKEKVLKEIQKQIQKSNNPDNCLKDVIVNIDESVYNNGEYGGCIKSHLDSSNIAYRLRLASSGLISWSRKIREIDNLVIHETELDEKYYLLILTPNQFGSLMQLIRSIKDKTGFHHLTVLVYGLGQPTDAQEEEMLEVEMFYSTFWQFVTTKEDLSSFVFMATKSVAQVRYKSKQEEKYILQSEYFNDANKNVVKVDKTGNGLSRLWRQMLTMFPLARLETAEAVTAVYPTLQSLFEAYQDVDADSGEKLIQSLQIRRAHGPLASVKKLGPELSRKCYIYFTSENNVLL